MSKQLTGTKSEIVEKIVKLKGKPVSFRDYPISKAVLDCDADIILLIAGRQVAKSFTNGCDILGDVTTLSWLDQLYVAPTVQQTKAFSTTKISTRIRESDFISKWFIDQHCTQNVFEKSFTTECRIHFRAATQLESIRGLEASKTRLDEVQDFTWDEMIIIEAVLDGQPKWNKYYSGTAKTLNNPIEVLRSKSNQIVPILICPDCKRPNIPSTKNIQPTGLFCRYCSKPPNPKLGRLSVRPPYFRLESIANKDSKIVSFWIPQVVLPLHAENPDKWSDLYRKFCEYPPEKFSNECMGISAGTSFALITKDHLMRCCKDYTGTAFHMSNDRESWMNFELFGGLDWAITQQTSFTVMSIGGINPATNRLTFVHISKILDPHPDAQIEGVIKLCKKYNISELAADWGSGYDRNEALRKALAPKIKVRQVQYVNQKTDFEWDAAAGLFKANRTKTLSRFFLALKAGAVHFPEWDSFKFFAPHYLAEYLEETQDKNGNTLIKYDHDPGNPDDALHSGNYLRLIVKRRKDPMNRYKW